MAISKKIRFEVFKRDGFQCAYCGKTPPEVALEVDHIEPRSKGGEDDLNNLITACFDCNRGKTNIKLDKIPNQLNENLEILKAKEDQLKEYRKFCIKLKNRLNSDILKVEKQFRIYYPEYSFNDSFKISVKKFIIELDLIDVLESMDSACLRFTIQNEPNQAIKYFCGICWNKIKERSNK